MKASGYVECQYFSNLQLQQETLKIGQDELDEEEEQKQESGPTKDSKESEEEVVAEENLAENDEVSFPETTSQMIGWKPEVLQRNEVERHARGKQDIVKLFKWPREGV